MLVGQISRGSVQQRSKQTKQRKYGKRNCAFVLQVQDKLLTAGRQPHSGGDRRSATLSVAGEDVIPMDSLHGYYRFVSHRRFGKAFKVRPLLHNRGAVCWGFWCLGW